MDHLLIGKTRYLRIKKNVNLIDSHLLILIC